MRKYLKIFKIYNFKFNYIYIYIYIYILKKMYLVLYTINTELVYKISGYNCKTNLSKT